MKNKEQIIGHLESACQLSKNDDNKHLQAVLKLIIGAVHANDEVFLYNETVGIAQKMFNRAQQAKIDSISINN
jgi:hypothetical protein